MSTDLVSAALGRPKVCQNCHNAHVSSKITLGDGADCEVLWVCRTCTLELQKHDDELATTAVGGSDTLEQGEFKTDDLERLFLAKTNKKINQKVADLAEHYQLLIRDEGVDGDGNKWNCVDIEFNFIEYVTGISIDQLKDCLLPENQPKNRYANVVAPDPTRVRLQPISGPTSDYINANWIPGRIPETEHRYIAAQGPLPNTVLDFWRMVYEHNVSVIMMLTQEIESERVKCEHYWPDANNPAIAFADVTVRFIQEDVTPEITTRYFDLTHSTSPDAVRRVTHFQYTEWPDFGQPSSCAAFLKLGTDCDAANHTNAPLLVHCSAGIGRTGTFIVVHTVFEEYRYYHEKQLPLTFNLIDVLVKIRAARPGLVQTKDQLQFCYRALCEAIAEYNNTHGPPAKVRAVKVQPLPPSGLPPALAKAAAAQVEIVPYDQAKKSLKKSGDIFVGDNSDDSTDTDSLDRRHRRRERARNGRPSIGSSSSGRRRKGSGHHSDGEPQRRRHSTRSSHGRRSRGDSRRHSPAASPSVLDRFAQEAKNGGTSGNTSSNDIYID